MKLKRFLRLNGLSSKELADELGISCSTFSRILRGVLLPSVFIARKIDCISGGKVSPKDFIDQFEAHHLGTLICDEKSKKKIKDFSKVYLKKCCEI
jgi:transcriptional regulator with XRE-family HTH domain